MKQPRAQYSIVALNLLLEDRTALTIIFSFLISWLLLILKQLLFLEKWHHCYYSLHHFACSACSNKLPPSFSCLLRYFQGALFSSSLLSNIAAFSIILHVANILQKIILGLQTYILNGNLVPTLCSYSTHAS